MATVDLTKGSAGYPAIKETAFTIIESGNLTVNVSGASDIMQSVDVPAGFLALGTVLQIVTAAVTTGAADMSCLVGDGDTAAGFGAANLGGAVNTCYHNDFSTASSFGLLGGKLYTAADTVDVKISNAFSNVTTYPVFKLKVYGLKAY